MIVIADSNVFVKIYKFLKTAMLIFSIMKRGDIGSPIIISSDGSVLDGNSRLRIAKTLGYKKVPVVRIASEIEYVNPDELKETY